MVIYLKADSLYEIGYLPDWLKVSYKEGEQNHELTLDIQGEHFYKENCLNCRSKGELVPLTLYSPDSGEKMDLCGLSDSEVEGLFSPKRILELLRTGFDFRVGIIPTDCNDAVLVAAGNDTLGLGKALCEIIVDEKLYQIPFEFEAELNN